MLSPYTGKEMKLVREQRTWNFRGERYEYTHTAYLCEDTGEQFTTAETDDDAYFQVTSQYREKYGIPTADEITSIRISYGLSSAKMSVILGFGINQWRLYEKGEVPSISNGRLIRTIKTPSVFLDLVDAAKNTLTEKEYDNIRDRVSALSHMDN